MTELEQLTWCLHEHATVWFGSKGWLGSSKGIEGVKVKVSDSSGGIWGRTLEEAISNIERIRKEQADISAAYRFLGSVRKEN